MGSKVRGLFNMARAFIPMLLSTHGGLATMINLSSSGALSARSGSSSYLTSKLAILGWTSSVQVEYAEQGLLTYCVNPGVIQT
jgi:NAD(P)-dependent dehydrogenase (short-subunit alcohol dehydrogenase family)